MFDNETKEMAVKVINLMEENRIKPYKCVTILMDLLVTILVVNNVNDEFLELTITEIRNLMSLRRKQYEEGFKEKC